MLFQKDCPNSCEVWILGGRSRLLKKLLHSLGKKIAIRTSLGRIFEITPPQLRVGVKIGRSEIDFKGNRQHLDPLDVGSGIKKKGRGSEKTSWFGA